MSWNYAELSSVAKSAGGPELFVQSLINTGRCQMILPMCTTGFVGMGLGIAIGIIGNKVIDYYVEKSSKEMQVLLSEIENQLEAEKNVSI